MLGRMMMGPMTSPLMRLQDDMNRLFEGFFEDLPALRPYSETYPGVNCWDDGETCWLEAELPGLSLNEIEVMVRGSEVVLKGQRKLQDYPGATWHRRERAQGEFSRTLSLPWDIDSEKVEAHLHDGVLQVKLPKAESARPRKVQVKSA